MSFLTKDIVGKLVQECVNLPFPRESYTTTISLMNLIREAA